MFKIGIYDRYLSTAGGGERYSCKLAEILSKIDGYNVDLVTDLYADINTVSKKLNLDLSRVNLKVFPFLSEDYALAITGEYDIFINATYLSSLCSSAKKSFYLCYFPTSFDVDFKVTHKLLIIFFRFFAVRLYRLADKISGGFKEIKIIEGVYDTKRFMLHRGSFTSGSTRIIYDFRCRQNSSLRGGQMCSRSEKDRAGKKEIRVGFKNPADLGVELIKSKMEIYEIKDKGNSNPEFLRLNSCKYYGDPGELNGCHKDMVFSEEVQISSGNKKIIEVNLEKSDASMFLLAVRSDTYSASAGNKKNMDTRKLGIVIYNEQKINIFQKFLLKVIGFIPMFLVTYPGNLSFLDSYDKIISISEYSSKWIRKLWKKDSVILYPPVDTDNYYCSKKQKIILSVGRFFPEHHNKKQLELAQNFIKLYKSSYDIFKDYRLILAGGVENKQEHLEYVRKIEEISKGYPVEILTNINWERLKDIFSEAMIFWHAAGMDEDEEKHPEKFEHFGITTVEAMASGCICVVINKGGQPEIIENGLNGFLFNSWEELRKITEDICSGLVDVKKISGNAMIKAGNFSSANFKEKLLKIIRC